MPGFLEPIWETIFRVATWSALIFGALSIGSAFVSAWVGWEITDATQKDADSKIKTADERIADAGARAAKANERAAILEKEAEQARLEQERLKGQLAWRALGSATQQRLADALAARQNRITIRYIAGDPESQALAMQFADVFKQANWQISPQTTTNRNVQIVGVFIPDEGGAETEFVRGAFKAAGVSYSPAGIPGGDISGTFREAGAVIVIGSKERPAF